VASAHRAWHLRDCRRVRPTTSTACGTSTVRDLTLDCPSRRWRVGKRSVLMLIAFTQRSNLRNGGRSPSGKAPHPRQSATRFEAAGFNPRCVEHVEEDERDLWQLHGRASYACAAAAGASTCRSEPAMLERLCASSACAATTAKNCAPMTRLKAKAGRISLMVDSNSRHDSGDAAAHAW
jgi:hypothetical protein